MIFTSVSPNTERDDVLLALKMLFSPWQWHRKEYITYLENTFKTYLPISYALAFQSGRNALYALLEALDVGEGDEVLMQAYTCVAVPEPVLWVHAKPVYVDVLADFTMDPISLRKRITSKSKVLIIQHTFGIPAKIDELMAIAKQYGLYVIEDCAHALGATYHNHNVGTFGDAAFFSFGRDKVISSVFGGMLVTNRHDIAQKVLSVEQTWRKPSSGYIIQQLLHPIITAVAKTLYNAFSIGKIILEVSKRLHLISKAVEPIELKGGQPKFVGMKMPPVLAALALHQFGKLKRYNEHRRYIAERYTEELLGMHFHLPSYDENTSPVALRYTILAALPKSLLLRARKKDIELGDWYTQSIAPRNVDYYKIGYNPALCPNAEELAQHSLNLPTHIGITDREVIDITRFLKNNA